MDGKYQIEALDMRELSQVIEMVKHSFDHYVAPGYSAEGVAEFYRHVSPECMRERIAHEGLDILCCKEAGAIVGMIGMRNRSHLALFFVDPAHFRKGIARALFNKCVERAAADEITVNSSPNAVPVYEKLGFMAVGEEETVNGIRAVPMKWSKD